ncbi:MAG: hypothetical protein FWG39_00670 [Alphaproteobacteria bacterium]|nr:hypothetical protein [Alphaproteobacteria bacterium]
MKFTHFFMAAICAAVFAFSAYAQVQYGEAGVYQAQVAAQQAAAGSQTYNPRSAAAQQSGRTGGAGAGSRGVAARGQAQGREGLGARAVTARTAAAPAAIATPATAGTTAQQSRATTTTQSARNAAPTARAATVTPRNVTGRAAASTQSRAVSARTGVMPQSARVGMVAGASATSRVPGTSVNSNSLLSQRMWTGSHANIIDPQTGLISAEAYANCMDAYYTCMDEICTARNPGQRRCACAGRVLTFNSAEKTLNQAREDLLRASGELALIVASGGRDISAAFTLTDAEKILNCVSFREVVFSDNENMKTEWCNNNTVALIAQSDTATCTAGTIRNFENTMCPGGMINSLNGMDSSISNLLNTANSNMQLVDTITRDNDMFAWLKNINSAYNITVDLGLRRPGESSVFGDTMVKDNLAETWGYDLFQFAHNEVCGRVLDSCFNGIYEDCKSNTPGNLNSKITISNNNTDVNNAFAIKSNSSSTAATAVCFGYNANSDPFENLRKPIADARRSVLVRYALDANADCDVYGEELKTMTQNMAFQRIAAMQALQAKRLEFETTETNAQRANSTAAKNNFVQCLTEIWDCYEQMQYQSQNWTTARIKAHCTQTSNIPSCYRDMICSPAHTSVAAIIDKVDNETCDNNQDPKLNTCRNVVTLSEILYGTGVTGTISQPTYGTGKKSKEIREWCLQQMNVDNIRDWGVLPDGSQGIQP